MLLIGLLLACSVSQTATAETLDEAVSAYQSAMQSSVRAERINGFRRAELLFRKVIEESNGTANANLYTNLGTACLSAEHVGPAIVAYRKALKIDPSHAQARKNLKHARQLLPTWSQARVSQSLLDTFRSTSSRKHLIVVAAICFCVGCLFLAVSIRWRVGFLKLLAFFPFVAWLMLTVFCYTTKPASNEGVVIREDVVARSADSHNSSQLFGEPLPSGAEVVVLEERGDWLRFSLSDRTAWIPRSAVEFVPAP
ncbi:hypothetical protein ACFL2H_07145 [Planctomycetota bacterium]